MSFLGWGLGIWNFQIFRGTHLLMPSLLTRRHSHVYVRGGVFQGRAGQLREGLITPTNRSRRGGRCLVGADLLGQAQRSGGLVLLQPGDEVPVDDLAVLVLVPRGRDWCCRSSRIGAPI